MVHGNSGGPFFAYRIAVEDRLIAFSGDTEWTDTLVEVARDADLLLIECYSYDKPIRNHLNFKTIEQNLARLTAKTLVLTHMSHDMLAQRHKVAQLTASDGMVVGSDSGPSALRRERWGRDEVAWQLRSNHGQEIEGRSFLAQPSSFERSLRGSEAGLSGRRLNASRSDEAPHTGHGCAVMSAASSPTRSESVRASPRSSAASSSCLISPTRLSPRNTSAE